MKISKALKREKKQGTRAKVHPVSGKSVLLIQEIQIKKARKIKREDQKASEG